MRGPSLRGVSCEVHTLRESSIRDANEHRNAALGYLASAFDQFTTQPVAEARPFARRAKDEEPTYAAADEMLNETLKTCDIKDIPFFQW
jgi:hypothetical protein